MLWPDELSSALDAVGNPALVAGLELFTALIQEVAALVQAILGNVFVKLFLSALALVGTVFVSKHIELWFIQIGLIPEPTVKIEALEPLGRQVLQDADGSDDEPDPPPNSPGGAARPDRRAFTKAEMREKLTVIKGGLWENALIFAAKLVYALRLAGMRLVQLTTRIDKASACLVAGPKVGIPNQLSERDIQQQQEAGALVIASDAILLEADDIGQQAMLLDCNPNLTVREPALPDFVSFGVEIAQVDCARNVMSTSDNDTTEYIHAHRAVKDHEVAVVPLSVDYDELADYLARLIFGEVEEVFSRELGENSDFLRKRRQDQRGFFIGMTGIVDTSNRPITMPLATFCDNDAWSMRQDLSSDLGKGLNAGFYCWTRFSVKCDGFLDVASIAIGIKAGALEQLTVGAWGMGMSLSIGKAYRQQEDVRRVPRVQDDRHSCLVAHHCSFDEVNVLIHTFGHRAHQAGTDVFSRKQNVKSTDTATYVRPASGAVHRRPSTSLFPVIQGNTGGGDIAGSRLLGTSARSLCQRQPVGMDRQDIRIWLKTDSVIEVREDPCLPPVNIGFLDGGLACLHQLLDGCCVPTQVDRHAGEGLELV